MTKDSLLEQGTELKECLSSIRKTVYLLENIEPDIIIVNNYQINKIDMTKELSQRLKEINENLAIFKRDSISIINATFCQFHSRSILVN